MKIVTQVLRPINADFRIHCILLILFAVCSLGLFGQSHGIEIDSALGQGADGLRINYAEDDGVYVDTAIATGIEVGYAGFNGVQIRDAGQYGVWVVDAGIDGIYVQNAHDDGVDVGSAGDNGVFIGIAEKDGIRVDIAGDDGVHVSFAEDDGIYVDHALGWSMNIQGSRNEIATPTGHIAQIYNRSAGSSADVLALKVGNNTNPGSASNFITFFNGSDEILGEVQGNGSGGISYTSAGSDYAEFLPVSDCQAVFQAGDIVGVHNGQISHQTAGADQVMVITDRAAVLGNRPPDTSGYEKVSFIGQVPVRVKGPVQSGDWIVADNNQSGVGIAIPPAEIRVDHQIVGRAWESSPDKSIKRVNTAVGLDQGAALLEIIQAQQTQLDQLRTMVREVLEATNPSN